MDPFDPGLDPTIGPASKRVRPARSDRVFLSAARLELVRPHVTEGETDPRPSSPGTMLSIQLMRQCFTLRNRTLEAALPDTPALRGFAGVGWESRRSDETAIPRVRQTPEKHRSIKQILGVADATLILASTPTKKAGSEHAPLRPTKKGEALHVGLKAHVGGDAGGRGACKWRVAETGATWKLRRVAYSARSRARPKSLTVTRKIASSRTRRGQCA